MSRNEEIAILRVDEYSDEAAAGIGQLMPFLSADHPGGPVAEVLLREIINSPDREQLIATLHGEIVGSAVLNQVVTNSRRITDLDNFVVNKRLWGQRVGYRLWLDMLRWSREQGSERIRFTSRPSREAAQRFYLRQGAIARDTAAFEFKIPRLKPWQIP